MAEHGTESMWTQIGLFVGSVGVGAAAEAAALRNLIRQIIAEETAANGGV